MAAVEAAIFAPIYLVFTLGVTDVGSVGAGLAAFDMAA